MILLYLFVCIFCEYVDYVDTTYGTYGLGFGMGALPTGVQRPFGMVRLSPDTVNKENAYLEVLHAGGFYFPDYYLRVFSHTHMVGPGVTDYGNIAVMPFSTSEGFLDYNLHIQEYNFKSAYKINEKRPSVFSVDLLDTHINVQLAATKWTGIHKYIFKKERMKYILFPVFHQLSDKKCMGSHVEIDPENGVVSGWMLNNGGLTSRIGGSKWYFYAKVNKKIDQYGIWENKEIKKGVKQSTGKEKEEIGAFLSFKDVEVEMYLGISSVGLEQAKMNLEKEVLSKFSENIFDNIEKESKKNWNDELGTIHVEGQNEDDKELFYSAYYRTLTAPTLFSESDGSYLGFDNQIHKIANDSVGYYSDMSIWDVHRTQYPLLTLTRPKLMNDIVRSLILMYEQGGDFPRWPIFNGYTGCMIGQHAFVSIVDAFLKGVINFDQEKAYEGMKIGATTVREHAGRQGVLDWIKYGFVPSNNVSKSCPRTLAYSYDDGIIAKFAKALGKTSDYDLFFERSKGYKKVWNEEHKFFCPKNLDGVFDCPKLFTDVFDDRYTEGDAWHYRFFTPHDVPGLVELFGNESFVKELETFTLREFEDVYTALPNKYFWVGNEHNLLSPWLFNYADRPDLTQKYIRKVVKTFFSATPGGNPGNDDYGTTSAWCVFGMLGFYPISGIPQYSISSPMFNSIKIKVKDTCNLEINLEDYSEENIYIQKILVNGKEHNQLFFDHEELSNCNTIQMYMGNTPQKRN